jgi:transcriptional regulator NrdR family protein
MWCPSCRPLEKTSVLESRASLVEVRRRRCCDKCGYRFTTYELPKSTLRKVKKAAKILEGMGELFGEIEGELNDV